MFTSKENYQEVANTIQGWDATQEEALLSRQLLSNIEKCGDHITITLTGKGISAIAKAIHDYMGFVDLPEDTPSDEDVLLSKHDLLKYGVNIPFGATYNQLAERWGWDRKTVMSYLKALHKMGVLEVKRASCNIEIRIQNLACVPQETSPETLGDPP